MSWGGDFQIKYKGGHPKQFHKLAKMIIPNSIIRFDFDNCEMSDNSAELSCTRNLSWYSADEDMSKLLSYMSDGDSITMEIDGEGEYEEVDISKQHGNILLTNTNEESERYKSDDIGIPEMLFQEMSSRYGGEPETKDVTSLDGYVQLVANTFADDEELMPVVQNFMYEVLDKDRINSYAWRDEEKLSQENCDKLDELREKFSTVESTSLFLKEQKKDELSFDSSEKQDISSLPDWVQAYPKTVINALGGPALLKQLIDKKGESEARSVIELLGGGIMDEMSMGTYDNDYDDDNFDAVYDDDSLDDDYEIEGKGVKR